MHCMKTKELQKYPCDSNQYALSFVQAVHIETIVTKTTTGLHDHHGPNSHILLHVTLNLRKTRTIDIHKSTSNMRLDTIVVILKASGNDYHPILSSKIREGVNCNWEVFTLFREFIFKLPQNAFFSFISLCST